LIVTLIVTGALCGVLAVLFHWCVETARNFLIGFALEREGVLRVALVVVTPAIVFTLIAFAIHKLAPRAVGANLARVRMAYNEDSSLVGWRSVLATFFATPLSLGAGAPLGPEGPITVITSGFSAAFARVLGLPKKLVRGMIPVGVAAGIGAVFNAPITGVVFALEEVVGTAERGLLGGVLVGAVAAAVVARLLLGGRALLAAPTSTWRDARELIGFALVGILGGLVSGGAIAITHRLKRTWAKAMPPVEVRVALAGLLIGAGGLIEPRALGVGYESISCWLHGGGSAETTAVAFAVKVLLVVIALSAGVLGGSFAPSLFIGTALGATVGLFAQSLFPAMGIDPKAYAIIGMGAFFAGLLRSPIAAVLIVIEVTRDYDLVLPLMLGVSLAVAVSRSISKLSLVEQQMIDEGYIEQHSGDPLAHVTVSEAMTPAPVLVHDDATIGEVPESRHRFYPVVDEDGKLAGLLARDAIHRSDPATPVRDVMDAAALIAKSNETVIDVVARMRMQRVDRCPVVDASQRVVGFLSPSDILRARLAQSGEGEEFELF
jgi:CIC family chloride channel protein